MVKSIGGRAAFAQTDVSQADQVETMVDQAVATYGSLNYAFNNAGYYPGMVPIGDYTEEMFDKAIATNLKGVWLCMKYQFPKMLSSGGGAIVNTASVAGMMGAAGQYGYIGSKWGVIGITRGAAREFAPTIRGQRGMPCSHRNPNGSK